MLCQSERHDQFDLAIDLIKYYEKLKISFNLLKY